MDVAENAKQLTLEAQYIAQGSIMAVRTRFLDLAMYQYAFMCRAKPDHNLQIQSEDFNHLLLIDYIWGECGEMEFIDIKGSQTGVRFYLPGPVELAEIDKYENAIRNNLSRPQIGLWLLENLGWTSMVIELFAKELYEHRVTSLQHIQGLAIDKLGLGTYPFSYFQNQPVPQTGTSLFQSDPWQPPAGISQFEPDRPQPQPGISQFQSDSPQPQLGISQKQAGTPQAQVEVKPAVPRENSPEESDISFTRDDQLLLRLWSDGLTVKEIGIRTGKSGKTVANRLSVLRGMYGEDRVPLRKKQLGKAWDKLG